jgi:putative glutamine amidotransferase
MTKIFSLALILSSLLVFSCQQKTPSDQESLPKTKHIVISKGKGHASYLAYQQWLKGIDSTIIITDLYYLSKDSVKWALENCDGLVLSGGPDINPLRYTSEWDTAVCGTIDHYRDSLEWQALTSALENKIPILGICRGLQLINIYHGGSLHIDLPSEKGTGKLHRDKPADSCYHAITSSESGLMFNITQVQKGYTNSNHHQGIKQLGNSLQALAYSQQDSLIEAIGWDENNNSTFMLAVQWHPERLNPRNPYSNSIGKAFLDAITNE